ncbi:MAG: hypothetical protein CMJ32_01985 [Phycisphaerae bacterium]|nr:hypothetical protein [Phycisphaerae bacterium]
MRSRQIVQRVQTQSPIDVEAMDVGHEPAKGPSQFDAVLDRMHGRWKLATIVGLSLGIIGAIVGYFFAPIEYTSLGSIRVRSELPFLLEETPETSGITNVTSHMGTIAQLIRSPRVIDNALEDPELVGFLQESPQVNLRQSIEEDLQSWAERGTELVRVQFKSSEPRLPAKIVNSLLRSYRALYSPDAEATFTEMTQRIRSLLTEERRKRADLKDQQHALRERSSFPVLDLRTLIDEQYTRKSNLERETTQLEAAINLMKQRLRAEGREPGPEEIPEPTQAELDSVDPLLADVRKQIKTAQLQYEMHKSRFLEGHMQIRKSQNTLRTLEAQYRTQLAIAKKAWLDGPGKKQRYGSMLQRLEQIDKESQALQISTSLMVKENAKYEELEEEIAQADDYINTLSKRLSQLLSEENVIRQGRETMIEAVALGFPSKDKKKQLAVAGFVGGLGIGFGIFFLLGTLDRKAFASSQLSLDPIPLRQLGVVPDINQVEPGKDGSTLIAESIHRVRNRIEASIREVADGDEGYAIMISSPNQGDGKTSLAASLGWSYASSGYSTLLADLDFIGRSLSHQFGRLHSDGIREVLNKGGINGEIANAGRENLDILGVGQDESMTAGNLHPQAVRKLFEELRSRYDRLLIDTGPMSASVESLPIMCAVDGIVLTIRRGRSRTNLRECVQEINAFGIDYLGVVLNCADIRDCNRYTSLSRMSKEVQQEMETPGRSSTGPEHPILNVLKEDQEPAGDSPNDQPPGPAS